MILKTWNVVTGKHICTYDKNSWLTISDYSTIWYDGNIAILVDNVNTQVDLKDEDFFEPWQLYTYAEKQRTYMKRCDRYYRKFVVVEIKSESDLNKIMEFDFPYFT